MRILRAFSGMIVQLKKDETIIVLSDDRTRVVLFATGLNYPILNKELAYKRLDGSFYEYKPTRVLLFTNCSHMSLTVECVMRKV